MLFTLAMFITKGCGGQMVKALDCEKKVKVDFEIQISYSCDLYMTNNNYGEMVRNQNKNTFNDPLTM